MEGSSRIDRKSSIEGEPRTLNIDQIQYAREAALYVLNSRSIEEASSIFTEGLEPVVSAVSEEERGTMMMMELESPDNEDEFDSSMIYYPSRQPTPRDVASAPF